MNQAAEISERLTAVEVQLHRIETHCQSMTDHIKFVDRVYHVLQAPFQMLLNIWSFTHSALPLQTSLKSATTAENLLHV
jgi:3-dehydroquinate dehydratase